MKYYDSNLTGQELDEAFRNLANLDDGIARASVSAERAQQSARDAESAKNGAAESAAQAKQAADLVQQQSTNLQNVTDNLEAIQGAAANAQAAAASAAAAQQAAQEALGFRTFFSAVRPDENGDLDPSRPMTTPSAASVSVKSKGDRIQSVQVDGFTTQAGTGDASPNNVRKISTAGMRMVRLVLTGAKNWVLAPSAAGANPAFAINVNVPPVSGVSEGQAADTQFCTDCPIKNADGYSGVCAWVYYTGASSGVRIRLFGAQSVDQFKSALASRYASGNPVIIWYVPADESKATGLYIPIQTQGNEYRCQMMELTAPLCKGDKVESCVPSGCDKRIVFDGSSDEAWAISFQNNGFYIEVPDVVTASADNVLTGAVLSDYLTEVKSASIYNATISYGIALYTAYHWICLRIQGVTTVDALKSHLQEHPLTVWYRSTAYTEANDIPVQLETHQRRSIIVPGTGWEANSSGDTLRFYLQYSTGLPDGWLLADSFKCSDFTPADTIANTNTNQGIGIYGNGIYLRWSSLFSDADAVNQYFSEHDVQLEYALETPAIYAHDPVTLVAVPYTEADVTAANQLASTPSTLPYIDSADVPMLLDAAEQAAPTALAANAVPVVGTYVVSSQDGTTVAVSLKAMQDGGDAATLGGLTLDDIKQLISGAVSAALNQ